MVDYIFVVGPFSSGTTAVTGMLMELGAITLAPMGQTNDPKTPTSLESVAFQRLCDELVSENHLQFWEGGRIRVIPLLSGLKKSVETIKGQLPPDHQIRPMVFKRATSALFLREIDVVFKPRFVFVNRDLEKIEQTALRRGWRLDVYGSTGAKVIYSHMRDFSKSHEVIEVEFESLRSDPEKHASDLASKLGLAPTSEMLSKATGWISEHQKKFNA